MHRLALALLAPAVLVAPARAQFEGTVHATMVGEGGRRTTPIVQHYKGGRMRFEMQGPDGRDMAMIIDGAAGKGMMLMPQQKMYMTMDVGEAAKQARDAELPAIAKGTGGETIAGIRCENWVITPAKSPGSRTDVCVAKGMGFLGMPGAGGRSSVPDLRRFAALAGDDPAWKEFTKDGAFPLRMVVTERGKEEMRMTVTKVEKRALDDALFAPPAGFVEMKMPAGMPPVPPRKP